MMQPAPETDAKLHHLLPQGYMRRFSPDGERVHVFDRITGKYRFSKTKNIAAQIDFYTMKTKDGRSERWIESRLAEIDASVSIFDKLERGGVLTGEERLRVAFFAGFADSRGSGFRSTTPPLSARDNDEDDEVFFLRFAQALSATTGVILEPWVLKNVVREDFAHLAMAGGFDENSVMIAHGCELAMQLVWTKWLVGLEPQGLAFITSDRPIGLRTRGGGFGEDAFDADLIRAFPLSPRAVLLFGPPTQAPSLVRCTFTAAAVRATNVAVARRADRNVLAESESLLRGVVADATLSQP